MFYFRTLQRLYFRAVKLLGTIVAIGKIRKYIIKTLLIAWLMAWQDLQAQNMKLIDSLNHEISIAASDSLKCAYHLELCYQWCEFSFDSAWYHATRQYDLALQLADPIAIREAINSKGLAFDYQFEFDSAIYYYNQSKSYAEEQKDSKGIAIADFNIGVVYSFQGEMEKSIDSYNAAAKVFFALNDQRNLSVLYNNLGIIYRKTGKYELARDSYEKSLAIKKIRSDYTGIISTLTNLSIVHQALGQYEKAEKIAKEVLTMAKSQGNEGIYLSGLGDLGNIYLELGKQKEALVIFLEAEKLLKPEDHYHTRFQVYHQVGKYYVDNDKLSKAAKYIQKVDEILIDEDALETSLMHYTTAYDYYKKLGKYDQALRYLEKAMSAQVALFDDEVLQKTTELDQLYEKDKRELEIERLNVENKLQNLNIEKNDRERTGLIGLVLLVLLIAILLFVLFRHKRHSVKARDLLLKEIHHRVKNNLQIISSLLNLQAGSLDNDAAKEAVKEGQNRVNSMALIHQRLYNTDDIRGVDAQDYLMNLTHELFTAFGVDEEDIGFEVVCEGLKMDIDTIIPLGLILNELITNALKYAFEGVENGMLQIDIREENEQLLVTVKDNGVGMDEADIKNSNSFGWKLIKSLSRKLKAEINVINDSGTTVQLSLNRYKLVK